MTLQPPAEWANGFELLRELTIDGRGVDHDFTRGGFSASPGSLPESWGRGFPSLGSLTLSYLGLTGSIPAAWHAPGAFPSLVSL